jgi:hypothetical protein
MRGFRLWDFRTSHDQLLLRSPRSTEDAKNLDIAFVGVECVALPTKLRDLSIDVPSDDELHEAERALGRPIPKSQVFVIESGAHRHLVVAAAVKIFENDLDMFESRLEKF